MHLNPPGAPFPPPPDLPHVHTPVNPLANPSSGDVLFAHTFAPMIGGGGTASASGGSGTVTSITLTQPAAGLTITGSGTPITTTGTPTFALANDLAALEGLGSTGLAARTGTDAWAQRTITGTAGAITVTNGSGAAGDPTITIAATYVGQSSITTLGTIATGVWAGTTITVPNGGTGRSSHTEWAVLCGGTTTTAAQQSVASVGTTGQVLTSNGAGAFPTFQSVAAANLTGRVTNDLIYLRDFKTSGTASGTFTSGGWKTRTLNTEVFDTGNHCTLASDQFTLLAGTYRIRARAQGALVGSHQLRLYNVTDSTETALGSNQYASATDTVINDATLMARFTIASSKTFRLEHYCSVTRATDGFGGVSGTGSGEVYAEVWIEREAS